MQKVRNFIPEWILTNRFGGYALGSADLINRRKYHGLLIASDEGLRRMHLVSCVEEKFVCRRSIFFLNSNRYPDVLYPDGAEHIQRVRLRPFPALLYSFNAGGKSILLIKEILMSEERNVTLLRYTNLSGEEIEFLFRYKFSLRDHHHVNHPGTYDHTVKEFDTFASGKVQAGWVRRNDAGCEAYVYSRTGQIVQDPMIFRNNTYTTEQERGYDAVEDLLAPFLHRGLVRPEGCVKVLLSERVLKEPMRRTMEQIMEEIEERYRSYALPQDHPALLRPAQQILRKQEYKKLLVLLMDEFRTHKDIVAGFPWFSAWGRDTMISLEGFMVLDEMIDFLYTVLHAYGQRIRNGLLPNVIGEDGKGTNFDTVDASLWYIVRVYECFGKMSQERRKELFEYCVAILLNYRFNDSLPFYFDEEDFLISIRDGISLALTWMDAKIGSTPVTPRYGKPVEINALWYNSVCAVRRMAQELRKEQLSSGGYTLSWNVLEEYEHTIRKSMGRFFGGGIFYDRIEGDRPVAEIRPNFVIACALPFDFIDRERLKTALTLARSKLFTSYGLRSLSKDSPLFSGTYGGNQEARDRAYHQGTVWTWLFLPYARLLKKVVTDSNDLRGELETCREQIHREITEGRLASIAEVWDGEDPGIPKGAPAQGWSTAALLCIERMIDELE